MPVWAVIITVLCSVCITIVSITTLVWNFFRSYSAEIKDSIEKSEHRINAKIDAHREDFKRYMSRTDERMDQHLKDHSTTEK